MLTNSSKYALKALLYLAKYSSEYNKVMVKDIFEPINVPHAYIAKLLQELSKRKVISSTRGPKGGFYLSNENRQQSVFSIIEIIDGKEKFNSCMLSLKECDEKKPCPLHKIANPLRSKLVKDLKNKTIEDLVEDLKIGNSFLPL